MNAPAIAATTSIWKSLLSFIPFRPAAPHSVERQFAGRLPGPRTGSVGRFERDVAIRFAHCDPAGIVFYPQYFVIMNGLMEDWFSEGLGVDFADLVARRRLGIPTVAIDCTFSRPSRLGEVVTFGVSVTRVGERSIGVEVQAVADGEVRLRATQTIVMMCLDTMKSISIPPDVRANLSRFRAVATPRAGVQGATHAEASRETGLVASDTAPVHVAG